MEELKNNWFAAKYMDVCAAWLQQQVGARHSSYRNYGCVLKERLYPDVLS